jgi:hypothetical protein
MKATMILIVMALSGCATSPYAWQDLGDGMGMRGYAGIPLRQSVPYALGHGLQGLGNGIASGVTPIPRFGTFQTSDGKFGSYYETGGGY